METGVIIALIFGIASIISSFCFGFIPTIRKKETDRLKRKIHILLKDIDSFYAIESILLDEYYNIANSNIKKEQFKKDIRKRVRDIKDYSLSDYTSPAKLTKELQKFSD